MAFFVRLYRCLEEAEAGKEDEVLPAKSAAEALKVAKHQCRNGYWVHVYRDELYEYHIYPE